MTKTQLIKAAGISTNAMAKLGKNEDVRVEVLVKICRTLECTMDDIIEIVPNEG
jgi:DNA-binding Xre family transcriptional regulator